MRTTRIRTLALGVTLVAGVIAGGLASAADENVVVFLVMDSADEPIAKIGVVEGEVGTVRFGEAGAVGFSPRLVDVAGNTVRFSVYDVVNLGKDDERRQRAEEFDLARGGVAMTHERAGIGRLKLKILDVHLGSA